MSVRAGSSRDALAVGHPYRKVCSSNGQTARVQGGEDLEYTDDDGFDLDLPLHGYIRQDERAQLEMQLTLCMTRLSDDTAENVFLLKLRISS